MCFSSKQENKFTPPDHTRPFYESMTPAIMELAGTPAPDYQGMRVPTMNAYQQGAGQLMTDRALYGDPQTNSARGALTSITQGGAMNPFGGATNPEFEKSLGYARDNMTTAFQRGTAAQNDALAARSGAYGGSAHLEKQALDAKGLADSIGGMESGMRNAQLNRAGDLFAGDRSAVMQASGMSPQFSLLDSQSFGDMMGYGNQLQNQLGQELGMSYQTYMDKYNHPFKMADFARNSLSGLSGGYGEGFNNQSKNPAGSLISMLLGGL